MTGPTPTLKVSHVILPYDSNKVVVAVPCYNEASRLDLAAFREFLSHPSEVHLVFIDDGSKDETRRVLNELVSGLENRASVLVLPENAGKAEAVRRGVLYALQSFQPDIVGYWDADLATPLASIDRFLGILDSCPEIQMVFGSRVKLLGRNVVRRPIRHYMGRVFATLASAFLRLPIYDTQCGAKLFRVACGTDRVFAEPFLSRWIFDVEIIARYIQPFGGVRSLEQAIYEYPLETWSDVHGSKVRTTDLPTAFFDLLRIRRRYLR